ncbi:MAG TPA: DUF488 family protein [Cyclobacteriaceae bacterium]|jgi:uncharacterized protein YeaO (DUF488 family)
MISVARAYNYKPAKGRFAILVDRLWPRGLRKEDLGVDLWLKDIAPSHELRKWFDHDPAKWDEFRKRYAEELSASAEVLKQIRQLERQHGEIVLLYGARDSKHNNAVALREILKSHR